MINILELINFPKQSTKYPYISHDAKSRESLTVCGCNMCSFTVGIFTSKDHVREQSFDSNYC